MLVEKPNKLIQLATGMAASEIAGLLSYPLKTVKANYLMEIGEENPKSVIGCIQQIYQEDGLRGYYKGVSVSFLYIPVSIMAFGLKFAMLAKKGKV